MEIEAEALQLLSAEAAWHFKAIPARIEAETLEVYCDESVERLNLQSELSVLLGHRVNATAVSSEELVSLINEHYRINNGKSTDNVATSKAFIDQVFDEAIRLKTSDIHIEPKPDKSGRIRFRVDGALLERFSVEANDYAKYVNQIKVQANLDIAERRLPQDGRLTISRSDGHIDVRVSTLPSVDGEKVVMRLLANREERVGLSELGLNSEGLDNFQRALQKGVGIILVTGPTGSGKTTSLYAALDSINTVDRNIVTIEDPVEYTLPGITQVQLNEAAGLSFTKALKSFLRQDPDVIMLGEMRDNLTAQMAIRASLTGHLVLSTLHTNSAILSVSRLRDMGIPSFLLADTLTLLVAQRLIRRLCDSCKTTTTSIPDNLKNILPSLKSMSKPVGCAACHGQGYRGRMAIYDIVPVTSELATAIRENKETSFLDGTSNGLVKASLDALSTGRTSYEEINPILLTL